MVNLPYDRKAMTEEQLAQHKSLLAHVKRQKPIANTSENLETYSIGDGRSKVYKPNTTVNEYNFIAQAISIWLWKWSTTEYFLPIARSDILHEAVQSYFTEKFSVKTLGRVIRCCQYEKVAFQHKDGMTYYHWENALDLQNSMYHYYTSWYRHPVVMKYNRDFPAGPETRPELVETIEELKFESLMDFFYYDRIKAMSEYKL